MKYILIFFRNFFRNLTIKNIKFNYLIFFVSGLLFPLAFPPLNFFPLFFFILILITLLIKTINSYKILFISQLCFASGIAISGLYWIIYAINYIVENPILNASLFLGFIVVYAIIFTPVFFLLFLYRSYAISYKFIIIASIGWSATEILKIYFLGGFPWFLSSQIWVFSDYMLQITSIISNLVFAILTIILSLSFLLFFDNKKNYRKKLSFVNIFVFIFMIFYLYGYMKINFSNVTMEQSNIEVPVRIVKTNINQKQKLDYNYNLLIFKDTLKLAFDNLDYNNLPKYIILPEVAFNFVLEDYPDLFAELVNKIPFKSVLLMGALRREGNNFYNSFYAISGKSKDIIYTYDKLKLVPFGEYIPIINNFPKLEELTGLFSLKRGNHHDYFKDIVEFNGRNIEINILPLICFEGLFPFFALKNPGYNLAVNLSNEAWFDQSIELEQNNSIVKLRAVESGISTLKVVNSGLTAWFDSKGRVIYKDNTSNSGIFDIKLTIYKNNNVSNYWLIFVIIIFILIGYIGLILKRLGKINKSGRRYKK